LLGRRQNFEGGDQLHSSYIDETGVSVQELNAADFLAIPPLPKGSGFARRNI
jgi:hypothetical protein